ncbi:MAG: helix-turn-helix transcriptional regulator [Xenococcaceae cyanobacterium MO_188.B19]|nr:helix-turn-helix transcriptional regulator [Xenococcaceae cyanobacterium MO_188.B19]
MINKIKNVVDSQKISVYKFRQETGISSTTAYELYNNPKHLPSIRVLERICQAYDLQPNDVLEMVPWEDYQKI